MSESVPRMLAHVAGLPLEETLLWAVPLGGYAGWLVFAHSRFGERRNRRTD
jgi:hypothetical protein